MTILELEQRTGLDRATIRYYEREGLITPARKENSYRDYSEEDAEEILKIKLLRQLDLSIDIIKQLQQGSAYISDVLRKQASTLESKITVTERATEVCKELSKEPVTYQTLNATPYLDRLNQNTPAETAQAPAAKQDFYREYHPVRRLIARLADYWMLSALIKFLLIVILRIRPYGDLLSNIVSYGVPFLAVPLLAWMEHKFGTTPGKWLMGIRIEYYKSGRLSMSDALIREWHALQYGYGFGIPFWRLWRMYRSYKDYQRPEPLVQDQSIEHIYSYWENFWNAGKKAIFAGFCVIIIALYCFSAFDLMKPKHRGNDLTVAEFAENFNYYSYAADYNLEMESDGTWPDPVYNGNVVVIGGSVQRENAPYDYTLEGERVKKISYHNTWTDFLTWTPFPKHIIVSCMAAVMSQPNMDIFDLQEVIQMLEDRQHLQIGKIQYENITIQWEIQTVQCYYTGSYYLPEQSAEAPMLSFQFDITIE